MNIETGFADRGPADRTLRPVVALPRSGIPGIVIAAIALLSAFVLFLVLDSQRRKAALPRATTAEQGVVFAAPPPLAIPPLAQSEPEFVPAAPTVTNVPTPPHVPAVGPAAPTSRIVSVAPPASAPPVPIPQLNTPFPPILSPSVPISSSAQGADLSEPALIIDSGMPVAAGTHKAPEQVSDSSVKPGMRSGATPISAERPLSSAARSMVLPAGSLIPAVLETPIDSSRPGPVRAIVSQNVRGFDGTRILVPRGSRLVGEFEAGKGKVLVNWSRLTLPDGTSVALDAPATDSAGGAGIKGHENSFFLARLFNTALQSAIFVGESLLTRRAGTTVVVSVPTASATTVAAQTLVPSAPPAPRITVKQGTLVNAFVAHDLDLSSPTSAR